MKQQLGRFLLLLAVIALLTACGGGGTTTAAPPQTVLSGLAKDVNGAGIPDVTVTVGAATAKTGTDGVYSLAVTPGTSLKVNAAKAGYVSTFDMISVSNGQSLKVDFSLLAVGNSISLTNMDTLEKTATDPKGAKVILPAGSVVDSNGVAVASATVDVTTALATDSNYTDNFPGLFVGKMTEDGADIPIESFGIVTVDITSAGNKCNLGPGQTATIEIPVAVGADPGPGTTTLDLWSLDETTGKWKHEGAATRDATASPVVYRATVSHFSTYNLDRPISSGMAFNVTVKNSAGATVAGAALLLKSTGSDGAVWEGRGTTGTDGTYRFPLIPLAGNVSLVAKYGSLTGSGYSYTTTGTEATMDITIIQTVSKTFTVEFPDQTPAPNVNMMVYSFSEGAHAPPANGTTNSSGKVTLDLRDGATAYNYSAYITIGADSYNVSGTATSIEGIPAKLTLIKQ